MELTSLCWKWRIPNTFKTTTNQHLLLLKYSAIIWITEKISNNTNSRVIANFISKRWSSNLQLQRLRIKLALLPTMFLFSYRYFVMSVTPLEVISSGITKKLAYFCEYASEMNKSSLIWKVLENIVGFGYWSFILNDWNVKLDNNWNNKLKRSFEKYDDFTDNTIRAVALLIKYHANLTTI